MLLHANGHDHHDFDAIAPSLASGFRVVAIDFPGHGDAPAPSASHAIGAARFADAVEEAVDTLALGRVGLLGNSLGGFAAARLAIRRPTQCWGLVLVQPGGFLEPTLRVHLASLVLGTPAVYRALVRRFAHRYMSPRGAADLSAVERAARHGERPDGARVSAALWRSFRLPEHDLRAGAGAIVAPTLVIWGGRDPVRPVSEAQDVVLAIPGARLEVLDTGHVPFVSDPACFLEVTQPFLRSCLSAEDA